MYTLKDLAQSTGLSDRTLRNYLNSGILQGQKENGLWTFTPGQIEDFLQNDAVKSAIQSKNKAILSNFWNDAHKKENAICMIWDLPESNPLEVMHFICDAVAQRNGMTMSFEWHGSKCRIILSGTEAHVAEILAQYRRLFS